MALGASLLVGADKDKGIAAGEPLTTSRTIAYHASEIATVNAEINFSTMIIFDKSEKILTGICGDADRWQVEHAENVVILKPDKAARGAQTNVNVVMESGNVYSFVVREISNEAGAQADLKIFVNPGEEKLINALTTKMFVSAATAEQYKHEAEDAKAQLEQQKKQDKVKIAEAQNTAPEHIRHDYKFASKGKAQKLFNVKAIYALNGFTYIEAEPQEAPAVYEVKDGKASLIQVDFKNGLYVIPKVVDKGYLKVGKEKLDFEREEKA